MVAKDDEVMELKVKTMLRLAWFAYDSTRDSLLESQSPFLCLGILLLLAPMAVGVLWERVHMWRIVKFGCLVIMYQHEGGVDRQR